MNPGRQRLRWVLFALSLAVTAPAWAHNADIATFVVQRQGPAWTLHVSFATAGLRRALPVQRGPAGPKAAQQAAVRLVRQGVALVADGTPLTLGAGGVRLGAHQSDLFFELRGAPERITSLLGSRVDVAHRAANQHNVLRLLREPPDTPRLEQWVLARRNRFTLTADVPASGSAGPDHGAPSPSSGAPLWLIVAAGVATLAAALRVAPPRP